MTEIKTGDWFDTIGDVVAHVTQVNDGTVVVDLMHQARTEGGWELEVFGTEALSVEQVQAAIREGSWTER